MRRMRRPYPQLHQDRSIQMAMMSSTHLPGFDSNTNADEDSLDITNDSSINQINEDEVQEDNSSGTSVGRRTRKRNHSVEDIQDDTKVSRILRSIREVISCCACFASETIMKECTNGHLICQNCFLTIRQDERPQCPTCRANLYSDSRRALVAQKVLAELPDTCPDCTAQMLHKALPNHRLNSCPKRLVACGLSALGCIWTGYADTYDEHYLQCDLKKQLLEQPLAENIDWLINRFKKREQTMRETFHCFSNVLRHLESHELQTVTVTLSNMSNSDGVLRYRSDHFHVNQSRWTAEIDLNLPNEAPLVSGENVSLDVPESATTESNVPNSVNVINDPHIINIPYPTHQEQSEPLDLHVVRRRRWHQGIGLRHHPYHVPTSTVPATNPIQSAARLAIPGTQDSASAALPTSMNPNNEYAELGQITYRMLKENSPGIGRRAYSFILLQIRVPDTGIQIYARPHLQSYRYSSRGDPSSTFTIHPIRWRHLTSLKDLTKYRLIQAEFVIARKLIDDHVDG